MKPTIGRIVHYKLTDQDAQIIALARQEANRGNAHGNTVSGGEVYPAMVVRVFNPDTSTANLQVFLDGVDSYWATSRTEGDQAGMWSWPMAA